MKKRSIQNIEPAKQAPKRETCTLQSELLYVVWIVVMMVIFRLISGL